MNGSPEALEKAGASIGVGLEARTAYRDDTGTVHITLSDGEEIEADELLVAIGRRPNTEGLGLNSIGLRCLLHGSPSTTSCASWTRRRVQRANSGRVVHVRHG